MPGTATYKYLFVIAFPIVFAGLWFKETYADVKMNKAAITRDVIAVFFGFIAVQLSFKDRISLVFWLDLPNDSRNKSKLIAYYFANAFIFSTRSLILNGLLKKAFALDWKIEEVEI